MRIDRQKQPPFLLRLFCKKGSFHRHNEFDTRGGPTEDELLIHTWRDATVDEILRLVSQADDSVLSARCGLRLIYADMQAMEYLHKDLGTFSVGSSAANATLDDLKFVIGDWVDLAIDPRDHIPVRDDRRYRGWERGRDRGRGGDRRREFHPHSRSDYRPNHRDYRDYRDDRRRR